MYHMTHSQSWDKIIEEPFYTLEENIDDGGVFRMAPSLPELTARAAKAEAEIEELVADLERMKRGR